MGEYARIWFQRMRSGESGAVPVILGLIVIVLFFQIKNSLFLSAGNLVNLLTQAAFIITLAMAEVFVLLLGEIDLAAGFTAACGAVIALWLLALNWPWWARCWWPWPRPPPTGRCRDSSSPGCDCPRSWSHWPGSSDCPAYCCS